jgi:hypothetical protein
LHHLSSFHLGNFCIELHVQNLAFTYELGEGLSQSTSFMFVEIKLHYEQLVSLHFSLKSLKSDHGYCPRVGAHSLAVQSGMSGGFSPNCELEHYVYS